MLPFQRDESIEREIDEEYRDQEEDRRQREAHVPEHIEPMIDIAVRYLIFARIGCLTTIAVEQRVKLSDYFSLGGIAQQPEIDG